MLLERAAAYFQSQGYLVKVAPCIIGDSGAIHAPDLEVRRDGEKGRVVFVLDELDGPMPLESRAANARDMGLEPVFVVGQPGPDVVHWAERHHRALVTEADLPGAAPPPEAPVRLPASPAAVEEAIPEDTGAELLPAPPLPAPAPPRIPERPLTAFQAPAAAPAPLPAPPAAAPPAPRLGRGRVVIPTEVPDDGDAMLLPSTPRADAPPPRPKGGRGAMPVLPATAPDDGDAMILTSAPRPAPRPPAPAAPAPPPPVPEASEDAGAAGSELLPSRPTSVGDADKVMKHDPSIWDPRGRLAQVRQAAKAQSFETTAVQGPSSGWLAGLKKRP